MIRVREAARRGHFDHGWLEAFHTFSFGDYVDADAMGFSNLRVLNEDFVQPGRGFPEHGHRDMEILTWVLEGALEHRDSMGNGAVLRPGETQRMTAGTGVRHSEFNASRSEPLHLLQIWILPRARGLAPGYEQKAFPEAERRGRLRLLASPDGREGSVTLFADASVRGALLDAGARLDHDLPPGRRAWLQIARGELTLNGTRLLAGDGAAVEGERGLALHAASPSELLLFELP